MSKIKKLIAVMLCVFMMLGVAPLSGFTGLFGYIKASAVYVEPDDNNYDWYANSDTTATLRWVSSEVATGDFTIPTQIGDYEVNEVEYVDWQNVTTLTIPATITNYYGCTGNSIEKYVVDSGNTNYCSDSKGVLYRCNGDNKYHYLVAVPAGAGFKSFSIPDEVESIYDSYYAFCGCSSIEEIKIGKNFDDYSSGNTFSQLTNLKSFSVDGGNERYSAVDGCLVENGYRLECYPRGREDSTFTVPEGITDINRYAFYYNDYLTKVVLSKSVSYVGSNAFYYCSNLDEIVVNGSASDFGNWFWPESPSTITIGKDSEYYAADENGVVFSKDGKTLIWAPKSGIISYAVPEGVEKIGYKAFYGSTDLTMVTFPSTLEYINSYAFAECDAIKSVTIPASVTHVNSYAFGGCDRLAGITIENGASGIAKYSFEDTAHYNNEENWISGVYTIGNYIINGENVEGSFTVPAGYYVGEYAFSNDYYYYSNNKLEALTVEDGATIDRCAFQRCTNLKTVAIGNNVSVGEMAFDDCDSLNSVSIGNNATIGGSAFYCSRKISSLTIGDNAVIGGSAFTDIEDLDSLTIGKGTDIGYEAFRNGSFKTIKIGDDSTVGEYAFEYSAVRNLTLGNNVELSSYSFAYCNDLETVTYGTNLHGGDASTFRDTKFLENIDTYENGLAYVGNILVKVDPTYTGTIVVKPGTTSIGDGMFAGSAITGIVLPSSMKTIYDGAFVACLKLKSVTLSEGIEEIGDGAFLGCVSLSSLSLPSTLKYIGNYAFALCTDLPAVTVPASVEGIGLLAFAGCTSVASYTVAPGNGYFKNDSAGALFTMDGKKLIAYPSKGNATSYSIPEGTVTAELAFASCQNLKSLTIPKSFTLIDPNELDDVGEMQMIEALLSLANVITLKLDVNSVKDFVYEYAEMIIDILANDDKSEQKNDAIKRLISTALGLLDDGLDSLNKMTDKQDFYKKLYDFVTGILSKAASNTFSEFKVASGHPYLYTDDGMLYMDISKGVDFLLDTFRTYLNNDTETVRTAEEIEEQIGNVREGIDEFNKDLQDYTGLNLYSKVLISCPSGKTGTVSIKNGTDYILPTAFAVCDLSKVKIPSSVNYLLIGDFILSKIDEINIPSSVEYIDTGAFALSRIGEISFDSRDEMPKSGLLAELLIDELIGFDMFGLKDASAPFLACIADKITLPRSVKTVNPLYFALAFSKEIELPASLETISTGAFAGNVILQKLDIPDKVKEIGSYAFVGSIALEELNIGRNSRLEKIGNYAFSLSDYSDVYIPAGVKEIGELAFAPTAGNTLRAVYGYIDGYIDEIKDAIVKGNLGNEAVVEIYDLLGQRPYITQGYGYINHNASDENEATITISNYVAQKTVEYSTILTIGAEASYAPIDSDVKWFVNGEEYSTGDELRLDCRENSTVQAKLIDSEGKVLAESETEEIIVNNTYFEDFKASVQERYEGKDLNEVVSDYVDKADSAVQNIISWFKGGVKFDVDSSNANYVSVDGSLYTKDMTTLVKANEALEGEFTVPNGVINIATGAFAASNITAVTLPDSVKTLGKYAFAGSVSLKEVTIGKGVASIPEYCFAFCNSLEKVVIPSTVSDIDDYAFMSTENISLDEELNYVFTIYGTPNSYAHDYAISKEINFASIDEKPFVTAVSIENTSSTKFSVYGYTMPGETVEVYQKVETKGNPADILIGRAIAIGNTWETVVELQNAVSGTTYEIYAQILTGTENETVSESVFVNYNTELPAFVNMYIHHNNQSRYVDTENLGQQMKYMSFSSYSPFTFKIKLSKYDGSQTLYVVSTKDGVSKKLPAVYDKRTDSYIASGYFDENDHGYVPGVITLVLGNKTIKGLSVQIPFIIDPSGFVYEGVLSNRVEDATAVLFNLVTDENGISTEQEWKDAVLYGQESSIITLIDGEFNWEVPDGKWKVKVSKEGYEDGESDWLDVPPIQTDIHIGLISKLFPAIKTIYGYDEGVDLEFTQYMDVETVNTETVTIKDIDGNIVSGSWNAVNAEASGADHRVSLASIYRFTSNSALTSEKYTLTVDGVVSYNGKKLEGFEQEFTVQTFVDTLDVPEEVTIVYGAEESTKISINAGKGAAGKNVIIGTDNDYVLEKMAEAKLDADGCAEIYLTALEPGVTEITFMLEGTTLKQTTTVNCVMPSEYEAEGITLRQDAIEIYDDEQYQLYADVYPEYATNKDISWASSEPSVAVVEDGLVIAGKAGETTITATVNGKYKAECKVTVVEMDKHTWTFDANGGSAVEPITEMAGREIEMPTTKKDGYVFKYWADESGEAFTSNVMTDYDVNLKAVFEPITYYATFIADGKQIGEKIPFTIEDTVINEPLVPQKEGYTGKWSEYTIVASDITVNAIYEIKENPDQPDNPTANVNLVVKSGEVLKNSKVTVIAKATGVPEGYVLAIYDGGKNPVVKGDRNTVKYEIPNEVSSTKTLTVKVIDKDGNVQKDANGNELSKNIEIKVKTGFLNNIIAFFKKLFRSNAVTIEP